MKITMKQMKDRINGLKKSNYTYNQLVVANERAKLCLSSNNINSVIDCFYSGIKKSILSESTILDLFDYIVENGNDTQVYNSCITILNELTNKVAKPADFATNFKKRLTRANNKTFNKLKKKYKYGLTKKVKSTDKGLVVKKESTAFDICNEITDKLNKIVSIDRILENYNTISRRFNLDKVFKENTPVNGELDTAIEICKLVDTYDMNDKVKYNTALETVWYGLNKNGFSFNENSIVTVITDYYMSTGVNSYNCKSLLETSVIFNETNYNGDLEVILDDDDLEEVVTEGKLSAKQRKNVKDSDFGIPSKKKYPMPDESHVRSAIQMFNHVDKEDESELARNINKKIKQYGLDIKVGKDNRFSKYYKESVEENIVEDIQNYASLLEVDNNKQKNNKTNNNKPFKINNPFNNNNKKKENLTPMQILNGYKSANSKQKTVPQFFQNMIRRFFASDMDEAIGGIQSLLQYIRFTFVLGMVVINPIIGFGAAIADMMISHHVKREQVVKAKEAFEKEIKDIDKKIEKTTSNSNREKLQKYRKELSDAYKKLDSYEDDLLSDQEQEEKYDKEDTFDPDEGEIDFSSYSSKSSSDKDNNGGEGDDDSDDDDDFNFDDDDFNFDDDDDFKDEATMITVVDSLIDAIQEQNLDFSPNRLSTILVECPSIASEIRGLTNIDSSIVNRDDFIKALNMSKGSEYLDSVGKYTISSTYDKAMKDNLFDFDKEYNRVYNIYEAANMLLYKYKIVLSLNEIASLYGNTITESFNGKNIKKKFSNFTKNNKPMNTIKKNVDNIKKTVTNKDNKMKKAKQSKPSSIVNNVKGKIMPDTKKIAEKIDGPSLSNKLKLTGISIGKLGTKISDKDKQISKEIDMGVDSLKKSITRAVDADSANAVVNGEFLPKASKIIKLAITSAGLWFLINPAISVISLLGYFGTRVYMQKRAKGRILDEIEIELKMCDKYIENAEGKNDMKALKQLLTIKKALEKQRAKLKYNYSIKGINTNNPEEMDVN